MSAKSPLELHHEFYERRQREIESRESHKRRDLVKPTAPSGNGDNGQIPLIQPNGQRHE